MMQKNKIFNFLDLNCQNKREMKSVLKEEGYKGIILLNINSFRAINESYGHDFGDKTLQAFVERIQTIIPDYSSLYHISNSEFAIIIKNPVKCHGYIVEKISKNIFDIPIKIDNIELNLTIKASCARSNKNLYNKVESGMLFAEEQNLDFVCSYEHPHLKSRFSKSTKTTSIIKNAISHDKIYPYGQKIFNAFDKNSYKIESLMRLKDDMGNILTPNSFLEQSKKSNLYSKLMNKMMEKTFLYFSTNNLDFSINLTATDILDKHTTDNFFQFIKQFNMKNRVTVELVESEEVANNPEVFKFLKKAKKCGCKIAIDDFGSGYSNFNYIFKIVADYLKIDGSLIKTIDTDQKSYITLKAIISLAKKLNMEVIAEYVYSEKIYEIVKNLGVNYVQGFYLHEPEELTISA